MAVFHPKTKALGFHTATFGKNIMKVRKSLQYLIDNPMSIVVNFLILCILGSSLGTILDDPFLYETWEYLSRDSKAAVDDLPWSVWKFVDVLSVFVDEAVRDFSYNAWLFFIPFALAITYQEAVGSQRGSAKERNIWMEFYETRLKIIPRGDEIEIAHITEDRISDSYLRTLLKSLLILVRNPLLLVLHFTAWVFALAMFLFIFSLNEGIVNASGNFVRSILQNTEQAILCAFISSFREARGYVKGIAIERQVWTKWYDRQIDNIEKGETISNPPPSEKVRWDSYIMKIQNTFRLIYSDATHFGIQFALWCAIFALLSLPSFGYTRNPTYTSLIGSFVIPGMLVTFLICYRKARGIIKGRDKEQGVWVRWCQHQKIAKIIGAAPNKPPSLYEEIDNSYIQTMKNTLILMMRNPINLVIHFIGWIIVFVVLFGATDWFRVVEWSSEMDQFLIVLFLAIISSYQETKGSFIGIMKKRKTWTEWYHDDNITETGIPSIMEIIPG